jgi:hypothetical protein
MTSIIRQSESALPEVRQSVARSDTSPDGTLSDDGEVGTDVLCNTGLGLSVLFNSDHINVIFGTVWSLA